MKNSKEKTFPDYKINEMLTNDEKYIPHKKNDG